MSNPQQNLKIPGERIQYATEENAGVVQIAKDINSLTNPEHVPTVKTIQEQFGSEFTYQQGVVLITEEGTDFDYYKKPGIYRAVNSGIAKSMMNKPKDNLGAGLLIVQRTTGSNLFEETSTYSLHQTYIEYMGDTFNRRYNDNPGAKNFTDWAYDVDSRNISSRMIMHQNYILIDGSNGVEDLNHYRTAGIYMVNRTQVAIDGKNFPVQAAGAIVQYRTTGNHLVSTYYPFNDEGSFTRLWNADRGWSDWVLNLNNKNISSKMIMEENPIRLAENMTDIVDLNDIREGGVYMNHWRVIAEKGKNFPIPDAGSLVVYKITGGEGRSVTQFYYPMRNGNIYFYRNFSDGKWELWSKSIPEFQRIGSSVDLNNYKEPGRFVQPSISGAVSGVNYPSKVAGALVVLKTTDNDDSVDRNSFRQLYYPFNSTFIFTRYYNGDSGQQKWYPWEVIKSTGTLHPRDVMLNTESIGNSNLNTYTEPGIFFQTDIKISTTGLNYPENGIAGSLIVLKTGAVSRKQIFHLHDKPIFYIREMANSVNSWTKWEKFVPVSHQLGYSQKWNSYHVNNTRKANTDYTNDTNAPIQVNISCVVTKTLPQITIDVDNVTASSFAVSSTLSPEGTNVRGSVTAIVPPGSKYRLRTEGTFTTSALITWSELR
ncbi:pyocin knob domain-containing protein [Proteus mirabilis]|uniref:pyocin knob domain-containing protein n=1 Tax=Proteus mirabilis TaxID=584 RepID=UPI0034D685D9